jgi:hypothetical protein
LGHVCDISYDITPLLTSFLPSEGPDVGSAVSVGHLGMVIRDVANLPSMASSMWDATLFLNMPCSIAEQALVDVHAIMCGVTIPAAPEAVCAIFIGAVFPPVHEVVKSCIKHGSGDI